MSRSRRPSMIWSARLNAAVTLAGEVHKHHPRKGSRIAYIAHLFDVASVAIKHGADEDEVVAAFLHDTLEDGDDPESLRRTIRRRFGAPVLRIVEACTDTTEHPKPPWPARKQAYLDSIASMSKSAKLVSAADKLANLDDIIRDHANHGNRLWRRFNGGRDGTLWFYRGCARELAKGTGDARLAGLLRVLRNRLRVLTSIAAR